MILIIWSLFMTVNKETFSQFMLTIRRYVRDRLDPFQFDVDRSDHIPKEIVQDIRELGLFGLSINSSKDC